MHPLSPPASPSLSPTMVQSSSDGPLEPFLTPAQETPAFAFTQPGSPAPASRLLSRPRATCADVPVPSVESGSKEYRSGATPQPRPALVGLNTLAQSSIWTVHSLATVPTGSSDASDPGAHELPMAKSAQRVKELRALRAAHLPAPHPLEHTHSLPPDPCIPMLPRGRSLSASGTTIKSRAVHFPYLDPPSGGTTTTHWELESSDTVHLKQQSTSVVAVAIASAVGGGHLRHLRIPSTWGPRLLELLDTILPTLSEHLVTLDLSGCSLDQWPGGLRSCTHLEELDLSANPLGIVPTWLTELTNLHRLSLDKIGLRSLPAECAALRAVTSLSLAGNQLHQPPYWLYRLPQLEELHLDGNPFVQPWAKILAPIIESCRRSNSCSSGTQHHSSLQKFSFSSSFHNNSDSTLASTASFLPSARTSSGEGSDGHPLETPKGSKGKAHTMLPTPTKSNMSQGWTAKIKRSFKQGRTVSNPAPQSPMTPASAEPTAILTPSSSGVTQRLGSMSGSVYEDPISPLTGHQSVPSLLSMQPRPSRIDTGPFDQEVWSGARASPVPVSPEKVEQLEDNTHTHQVRALLQYLNDLETLSPSSRAPAPNTAAAVATPTPNPITTVASSPACTSPGGTSSDLNVGEHVVVLRSSARDDPARRIRVLEELIKSEKTYVKGLQTLVDVYVLPCKTKDSKSAVPPTHQKAVFSNVELLLQFHKLRFLPALQNAAMPLLNPSATVLRQHKTEEQRSRWALIQVAKVFLEQSGSLRLYSSYTNNFDRAQRIVTSWTQPLHSGIDTFRPRPSTRTRSSGLRKRSLGPSGSPTVPVPNVPFPPTKFPACLGSSPDDLELSTSERRAIQKYLKTASNDPRCSVLGLDSYLLLPVQRIPRYRLMLEDLVRSFAPDQLQEDQSGALVVSALVCVLRMAQTMNEDKRLAEQEQRLTMWHEYFQVEGVYAHEGIPPLIQPGRLLLKEGLLTLQRTVRPGTHVQSCEGLVSGVSPQDLTTTDLSGKGTTFTPAISVRFLQSELVGQEVTMVLCSDQILLLNKHEQPARNPIPARTSRRPSSILSSPMSLTTSKVSLPALNTHVGHQVVVRTCFELGRVNAAEQVMVDGPMIRLCGPQVIYYLLAASSTAATQWATSIRTAIQHHQPSI